MVKFPNLKLTKTFITNLDADSIIIIARLTRVGVDIEARVKQEEGRAAEVTTDLVTGSTLLDLLTSKTCRL